MKHLKILTLTTEPSSSRGGQPLSTFSICQNLARRGHEIKLLYWKEGDLLDRYGEFCSQIIEIEDHDLDKRQPLISAWQTLNNILKVTKKLNLCDRQNTLIYFDSCDNALFAALLSFFMGRIPSIFHIRQPPLERFPRKYLLGLRQVSKFIAVSEFTQKNWLACGLNPERMVVSLNGIEPDIFKPGHNLEELRKKWDISGDEILIAYIGRLDPEKGLETLIRALSLLHQSSTRPIKVIVAGQPVLHKSPEAGQQYENSLKALVHQLNLEKTVEFVGHLSNPVSLYQISDIVVLNSIYPEPCARTILESIACGIPILASNIGGNTKLLSSYPNFIFEPDNAKDLAQKLSLVSNWRKENPSLSVELREYFLKSYTINAVIDRVENILVETLTK